MKKKQRIQSEAEVRASYFYQCCLTKQASIKKYIGKEKTTDGSKFFTVEKEKEEKNEIRAYTYPNIVYLD